MNDKRGEVEMSEIVEEFCEYCGELIRPDQDIVYVKHDGAYHTDHVPQNLTEPTILLPAGKRTQYCAQCWTMGETLEATPEHQRIVHGKNA
jgi:hypothetical protein